MSQCFYERNKTLTRICILKRWISLIRNCNNYVILDIEHLFLYVVYIYISFMLLSILLYGIENYSQLKS